MAEMRWSLPNAALVFPGICFWDWKNFFRASASSSTSFLALKYLLVMSESFSTYSFWVLSMYLIKQVKVMQWQQTNQQPCPFESTSSGELTSRIGTCWPTGLAAETLFHLSFAVVCLVGLDISLRRMLQRPPRPRTAKRPWATQRWKMMKHLATLPGGGSK